MTFVSASASLASLFAHPMVNVGNQAGISAPTVSDCIDRLSAVAAVSADLVGTMSLHPSTVSRIQVAAESNGPRPVAAGAVSCLVGATAIDGDRIGDAPPALHFILAKVRESPENN